MFDPSARHKTTRNILISVFLMACDSGIAYANRAESIWVNADRCLIDADQCRITCGKQKPGICPDAQNVATDYFAALAFAISWMM